MIHRHNRALTLSNDKTTDVLIPLADLTKTERLVHENAAADWGDPAEILERKIRHLARILNCTEEEATHYFLHKL